MGRRFKHCGHFEVLIWNGNRDWAMQGTLIHLLFVLWKEVMPWSTSEPIRLWQSRLSMLRNLTSWIASWHQGCGTISRRWEGAWRILRWVAWSTRPHLSVYFILFLFTQPIYVKWSHQQLNELPWRRHRWYKQVLPGRSPYLCNDIVIKFEDICAWFSGSYPGWQANNVFFPSLSLLSLQPNLNPSSDSSIS